MLLQPSEGKSSHYPSGQVRNKQISTGRNVASHRHVILTTRGEAHQSLMLHDNRGVEANTNLII